MGIGASRAAGPAATEPQRSRAAAKLRPPALPADHVERRELLERLDGALVRRLTTVVAGPGYGKSTLLAAWASERGAVWYTIDERDDTLARFARGLSDALELRDMPGLEGEGGNEQARAEPLAELVCEALESRLDGDLALVLDDVHELRPRSPSARLLEALCRQAPPDFHLLLCSRAEPPFAIERLRGRGQVLALDAAALAFSRDEIAALLDESELVEPLFRLTEGWPAAVRLAVDSLRETPDDARGAHLDSLTKPQGALFPYLAEEVFAREQPSVRHLLRTVAPLERFSAELCDALGVPGAATTLTRLQKRGLFVHTQEDGSYALHALVRAFAHERWPLSAEELRSVRTQAADWLEDNGQAEEALRLATAAKEPEMVARLLREHGATLLAHGAPDNILGTAAVLDPAELDTDVELILGQAHAVKGHWQEAEACYARVADEAEELPAALAWRIGQMHWDRGEYERALGAYGRGRLDGSDPAGEALLLAWSAVAHWHQQDVDAAREAGERALDAARVSGDESALAAAHFALAFAAIGSDESACTEHARTALELAERAGDVLHIVRIRMLLSGRARSVELIEPAVRVAEVAGIDLYLAQTLLRRGCLRFDLGQLDAGVTDLERARSIFERIGSARVTFPLVHLGLRIIERGDLGRARMAFEDALTVLDQAPEPENLFLARLGLAQVIVADDPERATTLVEQAVELGPLPHQVSWGLVARGWIALACGARETASQLADEAALDSSDPEVLPEALQLQALAAPDPTSELQRLEEAAVLWRELGCPLEVAKADYALARVSDPPDERAAARAKRKLRALGVRDSAAGAAGLLMALGPERPPELELQALGGFRLIREGIPVPASEWQSKKARDLLKLLVARGGRSCRREVLIEALWPDEDPGKTGNRLSVALSKLRTVLDPEHAHGPEHFLAAGRDAVALEPGRIVVDADGFLAEAEAGLAAAHDGRREEALELLEAAEAAYTGDFLDEDLYEDWATGPREELRAAYVAVARALSQLADDPRTSARYLRRILERDPYDEQTHLDLVSALAAGRAQGESRRAYRAYAARMEEIGVEPAPYPGAP